MNWDRYLMRFADTAAIKSKDPSTKVGCVIVGEDREILSTGFNGLPRGVEDRPERMERPVKYYLTSHAEENAVAHAARVGARLKGASAYTTHFPCSRCARTLIQAGVVRVVSGGGTTSMPEEEFSYARMMFSEAGVVCEEI